MNELPLHISKHTQLGTKGDDHGAVVGNKYVITLVVDGIPFHTASFFGDDETVRGRAERVREKIREAEIKVVE